MAGNKSDVLKPQIPDFVIRFDPEAFDALVHSQGVRFEHHLAIRCPLGMADIGDNRRPHPDHENCSNGFLYKKKGIVIATLTGNGLEQRLQATGFVDGSVLQATFPRFYQDSGQPFSVAPFDRFYVDSPDIRVPTWQLVRAHETGLDRLQFPAEEVEWLVDSRGREYRYNDDFCLRDGRIAWLGDRPEPLLDEGGQILYSIRYQYRPWFYCARLMHEIRVSSQGVEAGDRIQRMPQQALLQREFLFQQEQIQDGPGFQPRAMPTAPEGQFGSR